MALSYIISKKVKTRLITRQKSDREIVNHRRGIIVYIENFRIGIRIFTAEAYSIGSLQGGNQRKRKEKLAVDRMDCSLWTVVS